MSGFSRPRYKITAGVNGKRQVETSSVNFNMGMNNGGSTTIGGLVGNQTSYASLMDGIIAEDETILQQIYQDMYLYDVSCGTTADLRSTLVSSPFNLTGLEDNMLEVFQSSIHRLGFPTVIPQMFLDMLVRGKFISTLVYNQEKKEFNDQIIHSAGDCTIIDNPLYSGKPVIRFRPPESMINFFTDSSDHAMSTRDRLNPEMVKLLSGRGEVDLDDLLTLYLPRPTIAGIASGTSIFRRCVPIYILEKLLYKGTLSEAQRRQRAILHITAGSDNWQPVDAELQAVVSMFQQADLDPVGAILATRNDISVSDIRPGGDFWKWTDITDSTSQMKLKAMGVSEAFLSGESSYNAMEVSLSVFLENLRSDRDYATNCIFQKHLFPLIAHANEFVRHKEGRRKTTATKLTGNASFDIGDPSQYYIPKLNWVKSLRPESDSEHLETLSELADKGVPIGISMFASAAGISIDEILSHKDKEIELTKKIQDYKQDLDEAISKGVDGDLDDGMEIASLRQTVARLENELSRNPKSLLSRNYDEIEETEEYQGKIKSVPSARTKSVRDKKRMNAQKLIKNLSNDDGDWEKARSIGRKLAGALR